MRLYRDQSDPLNHKLVATNTAPNASSVLIGFVYLNQDSDGDGLNDGVEYPVAGVPVSDPMFNIVADTVFVNGFE